MVGTRKGSKSKSKCLALVSAEPEPLNISNEQSDEGHSNGEEELDRFLNKEVMPVDEEEKDVITGGPAFGGGHEEEQFTNEVNDEEFVPFEITEILVDRPEDENINGDEEECTEEGSDGGDVPTNTDIENNNETADEEEPEEDEDPINFDLYNKDMNTGEEQKSPEVSMENNNEALVASEHGLVERMTENLDNGKEANELIAEEPMNTPADGRKEESIQEDPSTFDEVKAVAQKAIQPKQKIIKKRLVKKNIVRGTVVTGVNKANPQPSNGNDGSAESCKADTSKEPMLQPSVSNETSDEALKVDTNEHLNNEEKAKVQPTVKAIRKRNRIRKKKMPEGHLAVAAGKDEQKPTPTNVEPERKENNRTDEQGTMNEEAEKSEDRPNQLKRKRKKKVPKKDPLKANDKAIVDKPGSSKKGKASNKVDSMGMIFMCSSETKKDCYRYKVLGLPAGKKDLVLKIYKGMRLFLFDLDQRMLYGVYKAAGPGGFNIEPRAFKSQFPSQVRFTVLEECLPLAEERFKKVIKDNYFTKNKFDCQLTNEQVKNLCKLFHEFTEKAEPRREGGSQIFHKSTKKAEPKREGGSQRAVASSSIRREKKRKRVEDNRRVGLLSASALERERSRRRAHEEVRRVPVRIHEEVRRVPVRVHEEVRRVPVVRAHEEVRRSPMVIDERYRQPVVVYDRETYLPSIQSAPSYQPLRAEDPAYTRSYSYERAPAVDTYRRDSALDYRDLGHSSSRELRHPAERSHHDPYVLYREPRDYREPAYDTDTRRDHYNSYETETRRDHYNAYDSGSRRDDYNYSSEGRERGAEYIRSADLRPPLPLFRRY